MVYVHEKPVMIRGTVKDNIALAPRLRGLPREEAETAAEKAAEKLGITGLLDARAHTLSRGQQQLVSLARALAVNPEMLLLDEPLAHLDIKYRRLVLETLLELRDKGAGVVMVTHDTLLAASIADRVVLLEQGTTRILEGDEVERLLVHPLHGRTRQRL